MGNIEDDWVTDDQYEQIKEKLIDANGVDAIENATATIILHLHTLADGKPRKDLEAAFHSPAKAIDFDEIVSEVAPRDYFVDSRFNPFRQETNFDEQDYMKRPSHTLKAINQLISDLVSMLFGIDLIKSDDKDTRTFQPNGRRSQSRS